MQQKIWYNKLSGQELLADWLHFFDIADLWFNRKSVKRGATVEAVRDYVPAYLERNLVPGTRQHSTYEAGEFKPPEGVNPRAKQQQQLEDL